MSLDVYLISSQKISKEKGSGIFVRECSGTREISEEEWEARFPGTTPVKVSDELEETNEVFSANITHNLSRMAREAGIHGHLWRPDEIGITKASELIEPLMEGLNKLETHPDRYKAYNPKNGWGDYEGLVSFVSDYLDACREYPAADIEVSR